MGCWHGIVAAAIAEMMMARHPEDPLGTNTRSTTVSEASSAYRREWLLKDRGVS